MTETELKTLLMDPDKELPRTRIEGFPNLSRIVLNGGGIRYNQAFQGFEALVFVSKASFYFEYAESILELEQACSDYKGDDE